LEPLSDTDSARLLGRLATRRRAKVRREEVMYAAEGNPLFLEQLVAMRADDPGVRTPPTIQALLAARIDALPQRERRAIEGAANLLERAAALRPREDPDRAALLIDHGGVLREQGRFSEADTVLREAGRLAAALPDRRLEARAQVERVLARLQVDPDAVARQV